MDIAPLLSPALALALALPGPAAAGQSTWYVDPDAPGNDSGTSWTDAFPGLQQALAAAAPGDELRVAEGVYRPDAGTGDRSLSFEIGPGLHVVGGYAGFGAPDPDLRAPDHHPVVLDGDLLGDDIEPFFNRADNSLRVVSVLPGATPTTLVGLSIRGGHADGTSGVSSGGGVFASGGSLVVDDCLLTANLARDKGGGVFTDGVALTVVDTRFVDNRVDGSNPASVAGGGLAVVGGSLEVLRARFVGNRVLTTSLGYGAGLAVTSATTSPAHIDTSRFLDNRVLRESASVFGGGSVGGGLYAAGPVDLVRCTFVDNSVAADLGTFGTAAGGGAALEAPGRVLACRFHGNTAGGSATRIGAGLYLTASDCLVADSVFTGNDTSITGNEGSGGGLAAFTDGPLSVRGCTFVDNRAASGAGLDMVGLDAAAVLEVRNSIVWANVTQGGTSGAGQLSASLSASLDVAFSDVQGAVPLPGPGNLAADPLFVDVLGADGLRGTEDDDVRVSAGSPCIDAGDVSALVGDSADLDCDGLLREEVPVDVDGRTRRVDDPATADTGSGGAPLVDLGALEFSASLPVQQWTDLGEALAGTHGAPTLSGSGTLCSGTALGLTLGNALENASAFLVLGVAVASLPFKGGVLVPSPDLVVGGLPTGPLGSLTLELPFSLAGGSGLSLVWQVWLPDPAGPVGFAASNGVLGLVP